MDEISAQRLGVLRSKSESINSVRLIHRVQNADPGGFRELHARSVEHHVTDGELHVLQ